MRSPDEPKFDDVYVSRHHLNNVYWPDHGVAPGALADPR